MVKATFTIGLLLVAWPALSQHVARLVIKDLPGHSVGDEIYLAGSFNGWNPGDEKFRVKKDEAGAYYFDLQLTDGTHEYKLTRGSWEKGECRKGGALRANRVLKLLSDTTVFLAVEEWADHFAAMPKISTASRNVCIIDTAFPIPQLKRTRRIWIYLPPGYCSDPGLNYPVLYMQDGQNLFDDTTSYSGEWGIDEYLDTTVSKKCIVVAADHGGSKRLNEYNPYANTQFGKGEGDLYLDFLVKTLKPFIDKHYRTKKDKQHTFIAGSSMGGLISMYAVLKYPKVFGGAGVFSPAFWISGPAIYRDIKRKGHRVRSRIYFYGGKQEGESMVPDMLKAFDEMSAVSSSEMSTVIRDDGKHNEPAWRKEFPLFYEWISVSLP